MISQFVAGLVLGYSLAVPPGPMNALIAAHSVRGFRYGFAVGAGAMTADFVFMLMTLVLYEALLAFAGTRYMFPFYLLGAGLLLYLAYAIARARPPDERRGAGATLGALHSYLTGLGLGLANPYQLGWWLTVGLSSIGQFGVSWAVGLFTAIATWITSFPAAVRAGWRLNKGATWLAIKVFSAATLAAFGVYFAYSAVLALLG